MFHWTYACTCDYPDSITINKWIQDADFVLEGTYITNLNPDQEDLRLSNTGESGYNILFRVSSVIKGKISSDTIAILQFNNGNCTQTFKKGESYFVFGYRIKKVKCKTITEINSVHTADSILEISINPEPPPPPGSLNTDTYILPECSIDIRDYWNRVTNKYKVIYTNYCLTFNQNSEIGKLLN